MEKTVKDCLIKHLSTDEFDLFMINLLKDKGFSKAMKYINSNKENYNSKPNHMVSMAFHWSRTPEGHQYWSDIQERLTNIIEN